MEETDGNVDAAAGVDGATRIAVVAREAPTARPNGSRRLQTKVNRARHLSRKAKECKAVEREDPDLTDGIRLVFCPESPRANWSVPQRE
jgi:hypothetical protein